MKNHRNGYLSPVSQFINLTNRPDIQFENYQVFGFKKMSSSGLAILVLMLWNDGLILLVGISSQKRKSHIT